MGRDGGAGGAVLSLWWGAAGLGFRGDPGLQALQSEGLSKCFVAGPGAESALGSRPPIGLFCSPRSSFGGARCRLPVHQKSGSL